MTRALVIRKYGDPALADALVTGVVAGSKKKPCDSVRRVAMHQHTPEEWAQMTEEVREERKRIRADGPVKRAILSIYGLIVLYVAAAWRYLDEWNRRGKRGKFRL